MNFLTVLFSLEMYEKLKQYQFLDNHPNNTRSLSVIIADALEHYFDTVGKPEREDLSKRQKDDKVFRETR